MYNTIDNRFLNVIDFSGFCIIYKCKRVRSSTQYDIFSSSGERTRAENEPSRSLKFYNHVLAVNPRLSSREIVMPTQRS